nr:adenosylcobinamide-GDP ribazoletransferase [Lachnospiraceae bacterium]
MIKSIIAAIGTFSVIPMPTVNLEDKHIKHTLIFFPTVGIIVGILEVLWYIICGVFSLPSLVFALIAALIPIAVTGGIHLDGFMDCMDGIHSYKGIEERLKILKDPHIGAFCVIKLAELGLLYLAA